MSVREEERQKNSNPSRGLGIAAAALGVGVGAALYYFLSKKPENPDGEGSTTGWSCEQPHAFNLHKHIFDTDTSMENNCSTTSLEDSYSTVSEATTTDTSIHSDSEESIDVIPDSLLESSEWVVPGSLLDVPTEDRTPVSPIRTMIGSLGALFSPRPSERRRRGTNLHKHIFDTDTSMENNCSTTSLEDSYSTVSEATTTDTSIHSDSEESIDVIPDSLLESSEWVVPGSLLDVPTEDRTPVSPIRTMIGSLGALFSPRPSERRRRGTNVKMNDSDSSMENNCSTTSLEDSYNAISEATTTDTSIHSDSEESIDAIPNSLLESSEWDVTRSPLDVPTEDRTPVSPIRMMIGRFGALFSPRPSERRRRGTSEEEHRNILRAQALSEEEHIKFLNAQKFRDRSWSLEECSICFEIMLKDQDLTRLPCAHNFHSSCLAPWLTEQQTCPNCRKAAE